MQTRSLWLTQGAPRYGGAKIPQQVDVAIIGAGITGLTAAIILKKSGKTVAVFDRERIGAGETSDTLAHLTYVTDTRIWELEHRFGRNAARLLWEGGRTEIDLIETNAVEQGIECMFQRVPGFLCAPFIRDDASRDDADVLQDEARLAADLGFAARYVVQGPVTGRPTVAFADQTFFHPLRYLAGLARAIDGDGSSVHELAEVGDVIQDPLAAVVNGETVSCDDVIITIHVPIVDSTGLASAMMFQTKLYPYSSYVLGAGGRRRTVAGPLSRHRRALSLLPHARGCGRPVCDLLPRGSQDGNGDEHCVALRRPRAGFPAPHPVGAHGAALDGAGDRDRRRPAFIGRTADHQYVGTGYSGNGLTFGTLDAMMFRDAITGTSSPLRELLDPGRKAASLHALATLVSEGADYPHHLIADRLPGGGKDGVDTVRPGEGKVLTIGGKRVACYRSESGALTKVSAVCTHLGCLVGGSWRRGRRTWWC